MAKTAMIRTRIEPELKSSVEAILHQVGLNPTDAITLFYKQVLLRRGLPFEVALTPQHAHDASYPDLSDTERDALDAEDLAAYHAVKANPPTGKSLHTLLAELGITDDVNKRQSA